MPDRQGPPPGQDDPTSGSTSGPRRSDRHQPRRRAWPFVLIVVLVLGLALAGGGAFWFLRGRDAPAPVSLEDSTTPGDTASAGTYVGEWTVTQGEETFVGYRVREEFAQFSSPVDAVGRTSAVTGSLTLSEETLEAASFEADLTKLTSDDRRRDQRMSSSGLQTAEFPTASFALSEPVALPEQPQPGAVVNLEAAGELTLHGQTQPITFPLEGRWSGETLEVVGQQKIAMADYGITPPNIAGFVTVEDTGTLELRLTLARG